jgi:pimeloyl-ACP methyl ester carboxylesterase
MPSEGQPRFAITSDGARVAYQVAGRGAPLLLVHGVGDERSLWEPIVERLADHYTCVTLDLRGHGQSTGALEFGPFELARDVEAVVFEAGLRKPALIGHSLGGFVASMYAGSARAGVRAVINVDQPLAMEDFAPLVRQYEPALRAGQVKQVLLEVLSLIGLGAMPGALRERLEATRERLAPEVMLGVWGPLLEPELEPMLARVDRELARIAAPYLSLFGSEPAASYVTWLRTRVPHAEVESFGGQGHFLHLLDPDRFCARVRQFVG